MLKSPTSLNLTQCFEYLSSVFQENYLMQLKDLIESFQEVVWLISFGVTLRQILRVEILQKLLSHQNNPNPVFQWYG